MGCWDVFCFICGNPCHGMFGNFAKTIKEEYIDPEIKSSLPQSSKDKIKRLKASKNIVQELEKLDKNTRWMTNCTMLLIDDNVIHGVDETACNITFCKDKFCATQLGKHIDVLSKYTEKSEYSFKEFGLYGIFIHTDCWKFIKKTYKFDLKFSDLPKENSYSYAKNFNINYGLIEKYWAQDFEFDEVVLDKKQYLCSSPLKNDKNIKQIKKNINALKIKNDPKRIGPSSSATFYNEGTIKIGKNNNFWIKKNNKWIIINENIIKINITINLQKINKKDLNFLMKIPFIGMYNNNPIFIISSLLKKNNYELQLITIDSYKNNKFPKSLLT
jgi:hypothetical protein